MHKIKHLYFKLIENKDIDFLLRLRLNKSLSKYLQPMSADRKTHIQWLKNYKVREAAGNEYYFVINDRKLGALGLVRVYNIDYIDNSCVLGDWVLCEKNRPWYAVIESLLLVYEFIYNELGMQIANFSVKNENIKAINLHKNFGANFTHQDETNHYFQLSKTDYLRLKYRKYYKF